MKALKDSQRREIDQLVALGLNAPPVTQVTIAEFCSNVQALLQMVDTRDNLIVLQRLWIIFLAAVCVLLLTVMAVV